MTFPDLKYVCLGIPLAASECRASRSALPVMDRQGAILTAESSCFEACRASDIEKIERWQSYYFCCCCCYRCYRCIEYQAAQRGREALAQATHRNAKHVSRVQPRPQTSCSCSITPHNREGARVGEVDREIGDEREGFTSDEKDE